MDDSTLELQVKVSKMLGVGFALSVVGIGGIGSLAALILGLRARKIIRESNNQIVGIRMAWWCIIVGTLGVIILPPLIVIVLITNLK